jgi:hypothetical protein
VLNWLGDSLSLDPLPYQIKDSRVLTGGTVEIQYAKDQLLLTVAKENQDPLDTIIELTVDQNIPDTHVVGQARTKFAIDPKFGSLVSAAATMQISSAGPKDHEEDHARLFGQSPIPGGYAFKTKPEAKPWVQIDLGKQITVKALIIINAPSAAADIKQLRVQASDNGTDWKDVWQSTEAREQWLAEVSEVKAGVDTLGVSARYLRIQQSGARNTELSLQRVEVYGE